MFDILIRGGTLYDGTGRAGEKLDLGIQGDIIAAIGRFKPDQADHVMDATGMAVAPGFIDVHSHSDVSIMASPLAENKLLQGVTTEIAGNCGMSAAPFQEDVISELTLSPTEPQWHDFRSYFELVEKQGISLNLASHVGHGNVRATVVGLNEGAATPGQLQQMRGLIEQSAEQGAIGFSTGLIYPPGMYADTAELVECAKGIRGANGVYATHMRNEGARLQESIRETVEIGKRAEIPVHISHLKAGGKDNWSKLGHALEEIERARNEGIRVTCDRYPYTASATWLAAVLPHWAQAGGKERILERLENPTERSRIEAELRETRPGKGRWQRIMVPYAKSAADEDLKGLTVDEIAELRGAEPAAAVIDLLIETELSVRAIAFSMCEENMRRILRKPYVMIGSDSHAEGRDHAGEQAHPRAYGTFPRILGRLVRDGVLSLPEAIHKMTGLPAETFHLAKRGFLREGHFADVTVFNPERIMDLATYEEPARYPAGIECVIVNGTITVQNGAHTGQRAGRVLRGT